MHRRPPFVVLPAVVCLGILGGASGARAEEPAVASNPALASFGVTADLGRPDGAQLGVVVRPSPYWRASGSIGHNTIASGFRVGATLIPLPDRVAPILALEAGEYGSGDKDLSLEQLGIANSASVSAQVGYRYVNVHAGVELSARRFTFYFHGGLSWLDTTIEVTPPSLPGQQQLEQSLGLHLDLGATMHVTTVAPSARLGVIYFF